MKQIFALSRKFYWDVIEDIHRNNVNNENLGWEKGVYPSDDFIQNSLTKGELYTLTEKDTLYACVILNSEHNEGYDKCTWSITCDSSQVLTPHALAVNPAFQGKGIGKIVVKNILDIADSGFPGQWLPLSKDNNCHWRSCFSPASAARFRTHRIFHCTAGHSAWYTARNHTR